MALRRAELISPHRVQRDPLAWGILGELLARVRRDSPAGQELWGMAYRAGLTVQPLRVVFVITDTSRYLVVHDHQP